MKNQEEIIIYTDGACSGNPGPCGLGVVLIDGDKRRELSKYLGQGTNNIGELSAIGAAADAVPAGDRPLRIHTDSKYCIGVLSQGWTANSNQELVAEVKAALAQHSDWELIWVKAHSGVALNERADKLACQAVRNCTDTDWTRPGV